MSHQQKAIPDHTAVRVALWRALHLEIDSSPHVLTDDVGLKLASPESDWRQRPDMHPVGTQGYRAAIVARARLVEDLVSEACSQGISQYVILGAGLDSFAQRNSSLTSKLTIFEIDQPDTQAWKQNRLLELGLGIAKNLNFVPVDFEAGESWIKKLHSSGFQPDKPSIIASTGVAMYLTKDTNFKTLKEIASLAPKTILAMTFMLPPDLVDAEERKEYLAIQDRAKASGTPFLSFFSPDEMKDLGAKAGFTKAQHIPRSEIISRYFTGRADLLVPASGEEFLIATV